ncbi:MAG: hypothetical protein ACTIC1_08190 [Brevibacterium sp.]
MPFELRLLIMFFPGGLLILSGGFLLDVDPDFGTSVGLVGFALLILWPIISITGHARHRAKLKRQEEQVGKEGQVGNEDQEEAIADPLHSFVSAVEYLIFTVAVPSAVLGGMGALFVFAAGDDPDLEWVKILAGISMWGLLGAYLLILLRGRSASTLRIIGAALAVCGLAGILVVIAVLKEEGITGFGGVLMVIACVGMVACGGLADDHRPQYSYSRGTRQRLKLATMDLLPEQR